MCKIYSTYKILSYVVYNVPYFLEISQRRHLISKRCIMQRQFEGGVYRDRHACVYTASLISLFVCTYTARVHTYIIGDPVPCGEISRMAFSGTSYLKHAARFRGNTVYYYTTIIV